MDKKHDLLYFSCFQPENILVNTNIEDFYRTDTIHELHGKNYVYILFFDPLSFYKKNT